MERVEGRGKREEIMDRLRTEQEERSTVRWRNEMD